MPTYEYICNNCGATLEVRQSITEAPLKKCSKCGEEALKRGVGGGSALLFKGSGFYITDYKGGAKKSGAEESPSKECCPCGKNNSSCSESKPAE